MAGDDVRVYNRGGRLFFTAGLGDYVGQTWTLSFWIRLGQDAVPGHVVSFYHYQNSGVGIAFDRSVTDITADWSYREITGTIVDRGTHNTGEVYDGSKEFYIDYDYNPSAPNGTAFSFGEMWFYDKTGTQKYEVRGITLVPENAGGGVDSMTTFEEGKARNLALGSGGTIASTLDGANPSIYGYRPEYIPINLGNSVSLGETVKLTVSFDLVMTVATANPTLQVYNSNNKGPMQFSGVNALAGETHAAGETIEKRIAVTGNWSPRADANKPTNFLEFYSTYGTNNYFSISNLMVELGEVAHPWRPAPEDLSGVSDMVIATDTKTLAVAVDVQKVDTWYYQTASTGSAPAKPTTASPSGWQTTEFAFDASKAIWACQKTTLTDGTFYWGSVSKASAYEGAVVAKNAADGAQTTANSALARVTLKDTRNDNQTPQWYFTNYPKQIVQEFKLTSKIGITGAETYCYLETLVPWSDSSGGWPKQVATVSGKQLWRIGTSATAWGSWTDVKADAADAAKTATDYVTAVSGDGIWVTPSDAKPVNGAAASTTTGWHISDVLEYVRQGASWFKLWLDSTADKMKMRLGLETSGHIVLDDSGIEVMTDAGTSVARFGEDARIGSVEGVHQVLSDDALTFMNGSDSIAYVSQDKFYAANAEVSDAFYIGNYSIRKASDGKLVFGLRR